MKSAFLFFIGVFCFLLSNLSLSLEEVSESSEVVRSIDANLLTAVRKQKLLVFEANPGSEFQRLVLIGELEGKDSVILTAPLALPLLGNSYSPASYDGFYVGVAKEQAGMVSLVGSSGEIKKIRHGSASSGEYLYLRTVEEDNSRYEFDLRFKYDDVDKALVLKGLYLSLYNERCDKALLSVYAVSPGFLSGVDLRMFNGRDAFFYLSDLYVIAQRDVSISEKLMPQEDFDNFEKALANYRSGKVDELKTVMSYFVADGGIDPVCRPDSYVVNKYYYPQRVGWSNDLAFFFEQSGYHQEAIELLEHIVSKNPGRVVAYLNLADAYWALGNKSQAVARYKKYSEFMNAKGHAKKIPKRVLERSLGKKKAGLIYDPGPSTGAG